MCLTCACVLFVIYCDDGLCVVVARAIVCVLCVLRLFNVFVCVDCKRIEWSCMVWLSSLLFVFVCDWCLMCVPCVWCITRCCKC